MLGINSSPTEPASEAIDAEEPLSLSIEPEPEADDIERDPQAQSPDFNTEEYERIYENPFLSVTQNPLSTFSIDVDTASYANTRRFLSENRLPPPDAVRLEELINYFNYDYPQPTGDAPFSITTELGAAPWNPEHRTATGRSSGRTVRDRSTAS